MAIVFHCHHCGRKIEAPESAGGKYAPCPGCKGQVYIPAAIEDELQLAPVDPQEDQKKQKLMRETFEVTQNMLDAKQPAADNKTPAGNPQKSAPAEKVTDTLLKKWILSYLRKLADSELDQANALAKRIRTYSSQANNIIDQIALSEIPEKEIADLPPQVRSALIRDLRAKIS